MQGDEFQRNGKLESRAFREGKSNVGRIRMAKVWILDNSGL